MKEWRNIPFSFFFIKFCSFRWRVVAIFFKTMTTRQVYNLFQDLWKKFLVFFRRVKKVTKKVKFLEKNHIHWKRKKRIGVFETTFMNRQAYTCRKSSVQFNNLFNLSFPKHTAFIINQRVLHNKIILSKKVN